MRFCFILYNVDIKQLVYYLNIEMNYLGWVNFTILRPQTEMGLERFLSKGKLESF